MVAKYIEIEPGPRGGPVAIEFKGIERPPRFRGNSGIEITIKFNAGYGLKAGDAVKYKNIVIGEVVGIKLDQNLSGVVVRALLKNSPSQFTRKDTQFWVERPEVSLTNVRGLDTIVSGLYIATAPGKSSEQEVNFQGKPKSPYVMETSEEGLEFVLFNSQRHGLETGAPVLYRGFKVGYIISVGLSVDASRVEARVHILPAYKQLVRENSRFWSISGIDASFNFVSGFRLDMPSISSVIVGGIAFSTPDDFGNQIITGHEMAYFGKVDEDWLSWAPKIPIGSKQLTENQILSRPLRAKKRWSVPRLDIAGINTGKLLERKFERSGWVLMLSDDRLIGPTDLLSFSKNDSIENITLEVGGKEIALTHDIVDRFGDMALLKVPAGMLDDNLKLPVSYIRNPENTEALLMLTGSFEESFYPEDDWSINHPRLRDSDWHGASVHSHQDGKLIGILIVKNNQSRVAPIPKELLKKTN